ncbi:MAG: hypothetical protein JSV80_02850 [Acidobacteriota bacterium]|nr:MAG: hypothetical protein JSV80_02850 [Acidobacteriota bacterium]
MRKVKPPSSRLGLFRTLLAMPFVVLVAAPDLAGGSKAVAVRPETVVIRPTVPDVSPVEPVVTEAAVVAVVVTDTDPASLFQPGSRYVAQPLSTGPFNAHETLNLYIITVYDRRAVGREPFDQVTRFILPDGSLYERRVTPIDPASLPGDAVNRADLDPAPSRVQSTPRLRRLSRSLPSGTITRAQARHATYTSVVLPVSGTWITKHNLYGVWKAEISAVRGGETFSSGETTFELGIDFE